MERTIFLLQFSLILVVSLAGRPEGIYIYIYIYREREREREREGGGEREWGRRESPLSKARFSKKVKQKYNSYRFRLLC
jgi:hypothetical protein